MREIKFRGRDEQGRWHFGMLRVWRDQSFAIETTQGLAVDFVDPATVGQFTGMRDCNGKEIYEGDILLDPDGEILTVFWNNGASSWECAGQVHHFLFIMRYIDMMQVIGNIHDNPQLLKEGGGNA